MQKIQTEVERLVSERVHEELQKLGRILGNEFGDRTGRFVSRYATELKMKDEEV